MEELELIVEPSTYPIMLAYLDPGTGSVLFSLIISLIATLYFTGKGLFYKISDNFLGGKLNKFNHILKNRDIIIYSEGKQYFSTFQPLLEEISAREINCLYLSSDSLDPNIDLFNNIDTLCIGNSHMAWNFLRKLKADICIMTTPNLDVFQIKKSPNVKHYMHVIHAPTDIAFYRTYAFDFFDSIIVNGPHQVHSLRYLEELRGVKRKELYEIGCVYYDYLKSKIDSTNTTNYSQDITILVAPTWGENGLLKKYGEMLLRPLIDSNFKIIIRPHPQSYISEGYLIDFLKKTLSDKNNVEWDESTDPIFPMSRADIMLSDISGVIFDFAFLLEKPVITVSFSPDKRGTDAMDLAYDPWELRVLDKIGQKIDESDFSQIKDIVIANLKKENQVESILALRDEFITNFGKSSKKIIDAIESIRFKL